MNDNDKKRFAAAATLLYKTFNKPAEPDVTRILFATLQHLDIESAEFCISQAIMKEPRFPIPKDLAKYQYDLPRKPLPRVEYKAQYNDKLKDHSMRLINGILDGKYNKEQIIDGMNSLGKEYPGLGWDEQALALVRYYNNEEPLVDGMTVTELADKLL